MDREEFCVKLSVQPSRGLVDEKIVVVVQNAVPGSQLTIRAFHQCEDGHNWEAFGHYRADATGTVNVKEDHSLGGTYRGAEQMGLLWSLRPVPGSKRGLRLRRNNVEMPMKVMISVYQGHHTEGFLDQEPLAGQLVERWYIAPGVSRIPVTEEGFTGTLFVPPGPGPFPAVLDVWGIGVAMVEHRAALMASNGFVSLAIEYMIHLLNSKSGRTVGNDYFETAYRFLQQHPTVLGSRIGMIGLSFGSAVTLKMAAYSKVVKLRCAICVSGSHVQPVDGSMVEFMKYFHKNSAKTIYNEDNQIIYRNLLLPIPDDPAYKVDMGRIKCPLLVVVGKDDQNWAAFEAALDMKEMMEQAGNSHLLTILAYPKTGHLIEPPYTPHTRVSLLRIFPAKDLVMNLWGGETVSHSYAQEDAWRKILTFLRENLYGNTSPAAISASHL